MALCRTVGTNLLLLRRASFATSVLALVVLSCLVCHDQWQRGPLFEAEQHSAYHRRLQQDLYPADLVLTKPYGEDPHRWLVCLHVIGISYMLLGLNTVCDVYFTGALEIMVEKWKIKPDVAGATFMAAGGSAPELFTSLVGATIANNDVGFGTIIGSAVFNVLFVIGLCGYVAKEPIKLTWWPLFRDCSFYVFGLSLLAGFASNELISLAEAIILFAAYLVYCVIMYFNSSLEAFVDSYTSRSAARNEDNAGKADPTRPPVVVGNWAGTSSGHISVVPEVTSPPTPCNDQPEPPSGHDAASRVPELGPTQPSQPSMPREISKSSEDDARILASQPLPAREPWSGGSESIERVRRDPANRKEDDVPDIVSSQPLPARGQKRLSARTARAAALQEASRSRLEERRQSDPEEALRDRQSSRPSAGMQQLQEQPEESKPADEEEQEQEQEEPGFMDFPDNSKDQLIWFFSLPVLLPIYLVTPEPNERLFLLTFLCSLVWIAGLSFLLVWWVEILGEALHIDSILMSFTLLAAGTSIPDAASSVAVAKQGEGDMAVSSSVGSNIFDILVGLPIPWMIKIALNDASYQVTIKSPFLAFHTILLLFMVVAVVLSIHCLGWKLNRALGLCMAVLYVAFLGIAVSVETLQPEWLKF